MIRSIDLFAGAGGLSLGLQAAGIDVIAAVERDKNCIGTLSHHLPSTELYSDDIRDLDLSRYRGAVDVVVGGPPCQPFSSGGLRAGIKDKRDMIPQFVRVVASLKPKMFLMENVRGLIAKGRRNYFEALLLELSSLGYNVAWKLINAADYGVPQKRIRLFVVGVSKGVFDFPEPSHGEGQNYPHKTVREVLSSEQIGEPNNSKVTYAKTPDLRPSPYHGQLFNGGGRPLNLEQPAPTILASAGGNKTHFIDTKNLVPPYHSHLLNGGSPRFGTLPGARRLTVAESAIIQTFPSDFAFSGSKSHQYKQIGNAVPPSLSKILGKAIVENLEGDGISIRKTDKKFERCVQASLFSIPNC